MATSYRDAGVDIDAGDELVERIKPLAKATRIAEVVGDVGGFAGLCALPSDIEDPLLVSGTDGVGTKLKIAHLTGKHDTIGIDLVAMCVNDIITVGARPLFFLDYFACQKLDVDVAEAVIKGIAEGCRQAGCALLGGETAEHPGMGVSGEYDLAGFAVGVVSKKALLGPARVAPGDQLIAVASSGLHSNGFSLVRKILDEKFELSEFVPQLGAELGAALLVPTRIYAKTVAALQRSLGPDLHALCHVTGGGVTGNLPRVLPEGTLAHVRMDHEPAAIFTLLQSLGAVETEQMRLTFNMGIGLVVAVSAERVGAALGALAEAGEKAWHLGEVRAAAGEPRVEYA